MWKFIFEKLPMNEILEVIFGKGDLLYEFSAETRLTVYRRLDMSSSKAPSEKPPTRLFQGWWSILIGADRKDFDRAADFLCACFVARRAMVYRQVKPEE